MKRYFLDFFFGILAALVVVTMPLIWHGHLLQGGWFPFLLVAIFVFLIYSRTPLYKKRHHQGPTTSLTAFVALFIGMIFIYLAVMLLAAYSITQWSTVY